VLARETLWDNEVLRAALLNDADAPLKDSLTDLLNDLLALILAEGETGLETGADGGLIRGETRATRLNEALTAALAGLSNAFEADATLTDKSFPSLRETETLNSGKRATRGVGGAVTRGMPIGGGTLPGREGGSNLTNNNSRDSGIIFNNSFLCSVISPSNFSERAISLRDTPNLTRVGSKNRFCDSINALDTPIKSGKSLALRATPGVIPNTSSAPFTTLVTPSGAKNPSGLGANTEVPLAVSCSPSF